MKLYHFWLHLIVVSMCFVSCKSTQSATHHIDARTPEVAHLYDDIAYLASDALEGREVGTSGEMRAAAYIARRMASIGCLPGGEYNSYYQFFTKRFATDPHGATSPDDPFIEGRNVIGWIDNGAPSTIIIGGHYDHLGMGAHGSLSTTPGIHNGADDNASGIAAMLALGELLPKRVPNFNYLLIAFSGEERGLWGSNYYVKHPTIDLSSVNCMINMDMVGRLDPARGLAIHGVGTSPSWSNVLVAYDDQFKDIPIKTYASGMGPSDFTSFYLQDIPVLSYFTGQHEDYHKPSDDIEKINFDGIRSVISMIQLAVSVVRDDGRLAFTKTKDESNDLPRFKVTLGVMPDYLYDGKGMRIDGIKDDRPAFIAGLEKGDVVIRLGSHPITDMTSYMKALSAFNSGDQTTVRVMRNGQEIDREIKF